MKTFTSIFLLYFICILGFPIISAQNFPSIAMFMELRTQNNDSLEQRLNCIEMELYDEYELKKGQILYTYEPINFSTEIPQWVDLIYVKNVAWNNRLSFQINDFNQVLRYLDEMKQLQFSYIANKMVDRQIYEIYSDGITIIELVTSEDRRFQNFYYNFLFYNKEEYDYAFAEENKKYIIPKPKATNTYADMKGLSIIKE